MLLRQLSIDGVSDKKIRCWCSEHNNTIYGMSIKIRFHRRFSDLQKLKLDAKFHVTKCDWSRRLGIWKFHVKWRRICIVIVTIRDFYKVAERNNETTLITQVQSWGQLGRSVFMGAFSDDIVEHIWWANIRLDLSDFWMFTASSFMSIANRDPENNFDWKL